MDARELFHTRKVANEGIVVPLYNPRTGEKTEHWLRIRGRDSDEARRAELTIRRRIVERAKDAAAKDAATLKAVLREAEDNETLRGLAALVMAWSFDKPCTEEAVVEFLREAPQIADAVDEVASKRALFFASESQTSGDLSRQRSSSNESPLGQSNQQEPT